MDRRLQQAPPPNTSPLPPLEENKTEAYIDIEEIKDIEERHQIEIASSNSPKPEKKSSPYSPPSRWKSLGLCLREVRVLIHYKKALNGITSPYHQQARTLYLGDGEEKKDTHQYAIEASGPMDGAKLIQSLKGAERRRHIHEIRLTDIDLGPDDVLALLTVHPFLYRLYLTRVSMNGARLTKLGTLRLMELSLCDCDLSEPSLFLILRNSTRLRSLELRYSNITGLCFQQLPGFLDGRIHGTIRSSMNRLVLEDCPEINCKDETLKVIFPNLETLVTPASEQAREDAQRKKQKTHLSHFICPKDPTVLDLVDNHLGVTLTSLKDQNICMIEIETLLIELRKHTECLPGLIQEAHARLPDLKVLELYFWYKDDEGLKKAIDELENNCSYTYTKHTVAGSDVKYALFKVKLGASEVGFNLF